MNPQVTHEGLASYAPPTCACWVFQHGFTARAEVSYESARPMTDSDANIPGQRLRASPGCAFQKWYPSGMKQPAFRNPGLTSSWNQPHLPLKDQDPDHSNQAYFLENASSSLPPHFVQRIRRFKWVAQLQEICQVLTFGIIHHSEQKHMHHTSMCLHYIWANNAPTQTGSAGPNFVGEFSKNERGVCDLL